MVYSQKIWICFELLDFAGRQMRKSYTVPTVLLASAVFECVSALLSGVCYCDVSVVLLTVRVLL
jgi:hypothetical protein